MSSIDISDALALAGLTITGAGLYLVWGLAAVLIELGSVCLAAAVLKARKKTRGENASNDKNFFQQR